MSIKMIFSFVLILAATSAQAFAQGVGAEGATRLVLNMSNLLDATSNAKDLKVVSVQLKKNLVFQQSILIEKNTLNCDSEGNSKFEGDPSACVSTKNLPGADFVEVKVKYNDYLPDSRTQGDTSSWQTQTGVVYMSPAQFTGGLKATARLRTNSYSHADPIYAPNGGDCFDAPAGCIPVVIGERSVTDQSTMIEVAPLN